RCASCGSPRVVSHPELATLTIAHLDCDAFYASVEKRDRPELRDLPVIVGGGKRGVVTTACYIARTYGPRSAMPMFKALKLCPDAVVIKPDFAKYTFESKRIMAMLRDLTPLVQPLSLDEAWLDLSGSERLHGGPAALTLARVQAKIERETGLTISIGLAANKFLAKIASDLDKPKGFAVIGSEAQAFLAPKPVGILPGVGPAFVKSLTAAGLRTVGDLAKADPKRLAEKFGSGGLRLHRLAHGQDVRAVDPDSERKSISAETTFNEDLTCVGDLEDVLWSLCEKVAERTRKSDTSGRVVVLKLRATDFKILTRRRTLPSPTQTARTLFTTARELLKGEATGRAFRLIGVGLSDFTDGPGEAVLFDPQNEARALSTETAVDKLRAKFGKAAVMTGRALRSGETASRETTMREAMESDPDSS
ncbi:MAG: DNA polymerase IV, partial [Pseudomonadota bacterium]|nr:DNA polymerase IV [Pseudomonadota bacterium]